MLAAGIINTGNALQIMTRIMRQVGTGLLWLAIAFMFLSIFGAIYTYFRYVVWPARWVILGFVVLVAMWSIVAGIIDHLNGRKRPMATIPEGYRPDCDYGDDRDDTN